MKYTGIILAGGKSTRFGEDKCLLKIGENYIISNLIKLLKLYCDEILISTNKKLNLKGEYTIVTDIIKDIGPLGGIYSCIKQAKNEKSIIVSCDSPFINNEILKIITAEDTNYDITVFKSKDKIQPISPGIYSKNILIKAELNIKDKNYKLLEIIKKSNSRILDIEEFYINNPEKVFININTKEELTKAKIIYNKKGNNGN